MPTKGAIIQFPGINREHDAAEAVVAAGGKLPDMIWYEETYLKNYDFIIIPGGFSYGDYLRCGAMAAKAPIMKDVIQQAKRGTPILGICNGFQILTEAGLLPGSLLRNHHLRFICRYQHLRIANNKNKFLQFYQSKQVVCYTIAHGDGNYFADNDTLNMLEDQECIALRYCNDDGQEDDNSNPNGSSRHIAGIFSRDYKILGLMPHAENAIFTKNRYHQEKGSDDGILLFKGLLSH